MSVGALAGLAYTLAGRKAMGSPSQTETADLILLNGSGPRSAAARQAGPGSSPGSFRRIRSSAKPAVARSRSLPTSPTASRSAGSWTISISARRRSHLLTCERSPVCRWTTRGERSRPTPPDTRSPTSTVTPEGGSCLRPRQARKFDASRGQKWAGRGHAGTLPRLMEGLERSQVSHR